MEDGNDVWERISHSGCVILALLSDGQLTKSMEGQVRYGDIRRNRGRRGSIVVASQLELYSLGLRLAIVQADARPAIPISFR